VVSSRSGITNSTLEDSRSHWKRAGDCEIDFASEDHLGQHLANGPKHHYYQECDPALLWRRSQDAAYEGEALVLCDTHKVGIEIGVTIKVDVALSHDLNRQVRCFDQRRGSFCTIRIVVIIRQGVM
jgi:hypothetical protein